MSKMPSTDYISLLTNDSIQMKHPIDNTKIITLYRIIARKTFRIKTWGVTIKKHQVGGFVESIENLENEPLWIDGSKGASRIFDDAVILKDSIIQNNALIFGKATISQSLIKHWSRVHGNSKIINSKLMDLCEVKDNAIIQDSELFNSAMVFQNAKVVSSSLRDGCTVLGDAKIQDTKMFNVSRVKGDANLSNCELLNKAIVRTGKHSGEVFNREIILKERRITPEPE